MIDMHSKYDNMHKNEIFYALIYINNHIITCINGMLSITDDGKAPYKSSYTLFDLLGPVV